MSAERKVLDDKSFAERKSPPDGWLIREAGIEDGWPFPVSKAITFRALDDGPNHLLFTFLSPALAIRLGTALVELGTELQSATQGEK